LNEKETVTGGITDVDLGGSREASYTRGYEKRLGVTEKEGEGKGG